MRRRWDLFWFGVEDVMARWWWLYLIIGVVIVPMLMWQMGFRGSSDGADCINYGVRAESC